MSRSAASPRPRHPPLGCRRVLASLHTYTAQPGLDTTSNTLHTSILYRHMSRGLVTTSNTTHVDTAYIPLHRPAQTTTRVTWPRYHLKHQTRGRACPLYIILYCMFTCRVAWSMLLNSVLDTRSKTPYTWQLLLTFILHRHVSRGLENALHLVWTMGS